jgi:hypothetical protein
LAGDDLFTLPESTHLFVTQQGGGEASGKSQGRRVMRARSGIKTFQSSACVLRFGRISGGVVMSVLSLLHFLFLYPLSKTASTEQTGSGNQQILTG